MITVERAGHAAIVWLDRPDKLNAMGPEFWEELPGVMAALGADAEVRAVVIAGRGRAFSVGLDLTAFGPAIAGGALGGGGATPAARNRVLFEEIKRLQAAITAVADCPKPVIAAIHGYCLGGGVDLVTACDIRLAATDAVFSVRETRLAMVADVGTLQRLPRIVAPGKAAEMIYTGGDYPAAAALEFGLVDRVYPDAEAVHAAARDLAARIAANSPLAVQGAKAVLRAGEGRSVAEGLDYVALWNAAMLQSADLAEAITAYGEGRVPGYRGE